MRTRTTIALTSILTAVAAPTALADMTGYVFQHSYEVSADGDSVFGGPAFSGTVIDLWLEFDDVDDVLLNVYNFNCGAPGTTYYQSVTGGTWLPNNLGPPFETDNLQYADSYVSIGGYNDGSQPGADGTGLDPNFGGTDADGPGANAGWYNSDPANPIGAVVETSRTSTGLGVFIGRFSMNGRSFNMEHGFGEATWNQGIGTPGDQAGFTCWPSPGPLAVFMIAGVARKRRRMN